ncbi:MAG: S1/P1 nuclease [Ahniella sp.]|nr:S1/P1 nuclease [Ahniella sp.]
MSLKPLLILSLLGALLGLAAPAGAWGPRGHELVAEIASRHLDPAVRKEIERLLGDRADLAMRDASTWADDARNEPAYKHTFNWHFVNFEQGDCTLNRKRQCPSDSCVFGAIERQTQLLGNRKLSDAKRAEALRFVIHFVGDVHQPLHAGWRHDRGGNDTQVRFRREGANLHALWDSMLIRRDKVRVREHADLITRQPLDVDDGWSAHAATDWTIESCKVVARSDFYPKGGDISQAYVDTFLPIAEQRLHEGGLRLAELLNRTLGR